MWVCIFVWHSWCQLVLYSYFHIFCCRKLQDSLIIGFEGYFQPGLRVINFQYSCHLSRGVRNQIWQETLCHAVKFFKLKNVVFAFVCEIYTKKTRWLEHTRCCGCDKHQLLNEFHRSSENPQTELRTRNSSGNQGKQKFKTVKVVTVRWLIGYLRKITHLLKK